MLSGVIFPRRHCPCFRGVFALAGIAATTGPRPSKAVATRVVIAEEAAPSLLTNSEVRLWYNQQLKALNTAVDFTEENARLLHASRNALKVKARSLMADREAASLLDVTDPVKPFEFYVEKYSKTGLKGTDLWRRIIQGSSTPNRDVNSKFGIE